MLAPTGFWILAGAQYTVAAGGCVISLKNTIFVRCVI